MGTMPTTPIYGFVQYDDTAEVEPDILISDAVQSIEDNLPLRYVATIGALAALSGSMHPNGQIAVLTADNSGVKAGSTFVRAGSKWLFNGGQVSNLSTFIGVLASNVATMPGASFYDLGDSLPKVFTDGAGANRVTAPTPRYATVAKTTTLQDIATTVDPVSFQTLIDGDSSFFTSAAPTVITIPEDGRYVVAGQLRVNSGYIEIAFSFAVNDLVNPNFLASAGDRATVAWPTARGSIELDLSAGDEISMRAQRFGGVNSKITANATWIQIRKVA